MVEIERRLTDQLAEYADEETGEHESIEIRTLNQDPKSRILLAVIAICVFGILLLLVFALAATLQDVIGLNIPGVTAVGKSLGKGSLGLVVSIILVIIALVSCFILRRRVRENSMLYTNAGCPQCWEQELVRVRRHKPDRVIAYLGTPVRRYKCRNCSWGGLRLGGQPPGREIEREDVPVDSFWGSDEILGVQQDETEESDNH